MLEKVSNKGGRSGGSTRFSLTISVGGKTRQDKRCNRSKAEKLDKQEGDFARMVYWNADVPRTIGDEEEDVLERHQFHRARKEKKGRGFRRHTLSG